MLCSIECVVLNAISSSKNTNDLSPTVCTNTVCNAKIPVPVPKYLFLFVTGTFVFNSLYIAHTHSVLLVLIRDVILRADSPDMIYANPASSLQHSLHASLSRESKIQCSDVHADGLTGTPLNALCPLLNL